MIRSSEARSQYLSLALTARGAMDCVRRVASGEGINEQVSNSLMKLFSIMLLEQGGNVVKQLQECSANTSFEEVSALEELLPRFAQADLARVFSSVINDADTAQKRDDAKVLVSFLGAVENKALQRYSDYLQPQIA